MTKEIPVGTINVGVTQCGHLTTDGCYHCCDRCNYDSHQCHGCGEPLSHGTEACKACTEYYAIIAVWAFNNRCGG